MSTMFEQSTLRSAGARGALGARARWIATSLSLASALTFVPAIANAQEPKKDCEPGSWFCGETQTSGKTLEPLPDAKPAETKPSETPPPVVVYQPPPPTVVVQPREAPPAYVYVPKKPPRKSEWGVNLHLGGAMLGEGKNGDAAMGLGGVGLRFRPVPNAALQVDLDFAGGRDYNGFKRNETALSFNGIVFLNPKSSTQLYLLGGFGWAGARAVDRESPGDPAYTYGYFGVQGGVGLEFRLSRTVALNVDLRGLLRGRIDRDRRDYPEFVSNDGRASNTSGAGLLTGGLTFYW